MIILFSCIEGTYWVFFISLVLERIFPNSPLFFSLGKIMKPTSLSPLYCHVPGVP
jgi:hypothetical protein